MTANEIDNWFDSVITYLDDMEHQANLASFSPFNTPEIKSECEYYAVYYAEGADWLADFFTREFPS